MSVLRFFQNLKRAKESGEGLTGLAARWYRNAGQLKYGRLVGEDQFGNKYEICVPCLRVGRYYEDGSDNVNSLTGRERWVEYADHQGRNASQVPPEWFVPTLFKLNVRRHSWLHFTTDSPLPRLNRPYIAEHVQNLTGTEKSYAPHNFMFNANYDPQLAKNATSSKPELDRHSARAKSMGFNVDDL